jgi:hypothetical protein
MKAMSRQTLVMGAFTLAMALSWAHPGLRAGWIKDGVPLCSSSGDQGYGYIATDGTGGAFFAWDEVRSDAEWDFDIFAQRLDEDGNILWNPDGVPICTVSGAQADPTIVQDGEGGVIIAWRDQRDQYFKIYVQRVDGEGNIQWTPNGVLVCTSNDPEYMPQVVPDGHGNFFIAWRDDRWGYGQVYCQKLDGNGNLLWAPEGLNVCPTRGWQDLPLMMSDTKGGVILAWHDERYGFLSHYIYAQRLDGEGNLLWDKKGACICEFDYYKWSLDCIPDGHGGGIVAWHGNGYGGGGGYEVFAQKFDSTGTLLWLNSGVPVCQAPGDQFSPHLASDDAGGAIISWLDNRDDRDDIYAQRLTAAGNARWQTDGLMIHMGPVSSGFGYSVPGIVRDGKGGGILSWTEGPGSNALWNILAQRVDGEGSILWPDTVYVCAAPGGQYTSSMREDGQGGAIIAWRDMRNGADQDGMAYAARITGDGQTVATLLQSFTARAQGRSIVIEWRLAEVDTGTRFIVLRTSGGSAYEELGAAGLRKDGLSFTFSDETCDPGSIYRYRVDIETGGKRRVLFESEAISLPALELSLAQNYPNPFNPATTIRFVLPEKASVRLAVYDCAGREIARLLDGECEAGANEVLWDGRDARGAAVGTGVYFYRLTAGKQVLTKKMVLLK